MALGVEVQHSTLIPPSEVNFDLSVSAIPKIDTKIDPLNIIISPISPDSTSLENNGFEIFEPQNVKSDEIIVDFTHPFQKEVFKEWIPVRGEIQPSDIALVLQDKSLKLQKIISELTPIERRGIIDKDSNKKERIIREMNYAMIATVDLLTSYGMNVDELLFEKETVMEEKYNPKFVTELRLYGPAEDPGRMTAKEAMRYLKNHFNQITEKQEYVFRNLPIPKDEEDSRKVQADKFKDRDQRFIDEWQLKAFGSDYDTSGVIVPNMIGENNELLAEIKKLTRNGLNDPKIDKTELAKEGIDFIIGTLGVLSAWDEDAGKGFEETIKYLKGKYKHTPDLVRHHGLEPKKAMTVIRDHEYRKRNGMKTSFTALSLGLS